MLKFVEFLLILVLDIVHYYGVYTSLDETQYIVLEYLSRGSVLDVLRRDFEILKLTELVEMVRQLPVQFTKLYYRLLVLRVEWLILNHR
jgi:serine/threonine protein kinase